MIRFWALLNFTGGYAMKLLDPANNGESGAWACWATAAFAAFAGFGCIGWWIFVDFCGFLGVKMKGF